MAVDGFPNMFQALGPNSAHGAGNLVIIIEAQVDYAVKATLKIQRERIKSMEAKREAVDDFERHIDVRDADFRWLIYATLTLLVPFRRVISH